MRFANGEADSAGSPFGMASRSRTFSASVSFDGGAHWRPITRQVPSVFLSRGVQVVPPVSLGGSAGLMGLYFATIGSASAALVVYRTTDHGRSWRLAAALHGDMTEQPQFAFTSGGHFGWITAGSTLFRSADGGVT